MAFQRIELQPGASGKVTVTLDSNASNHPLSVWDEKAHQWVMPAGRYTVWAGRSSAPADLAKAGFIDR